MCGTGNLPVGLGRSTIVATQTGSRCHRRAGRAPGARPWGGDGQAGFVRVGRRWRGPGEGGAACRNQARDGACGGGARWRLVICGDGSGCAVAPAAPLQVPRELSMFPRERLRARPPASRLPARAAPRPPLSARLLLLAEDEEGPGTAPACPPLACPPPTGLPPPRSSAGFGRVTRGREVRV